MLEENIFRIKCYFLKEGMGMSPACPILSNLSGYPPKRFFYNNSSIVTRGMSLFLASLSC